MNTNCHAVLTAPNGAIVHIAYANGHAGGHVLLPGQTLALLVPCRADIFVFTGLIHVKYAPNFEGVKMVGSGRQVTVFPVDDNSLKM